MNKKEEKYTASQQYERELDHQLYGYSVPLQCLRKLKLDLVEQYFVLNDENDSPKEQFDKEKVTKIIQNVPLEELNALMFKAYHTLKPNDYEEHGSFDKAFMKRAKRLVREAYQYERDQHNRLSVKTDTFVQSAVLSTIVSLIPLCIVGVPLLALMPPALIISMSLSLVVAPTFIVSMIVSYRFLRSAARAQFVFDALPQSAVTTQNEEAKVTPFSKTGELRKVKYTDSNDDEWLIGTKPQIARAKAQSLLNRYNKSVSGSNPKIRTNTQLVKDFKQFRTHTKRQSAITMQREMRRVTCDVKELSCKNFDDDSKNGSMQQQYKYLYKVPKKESFKPSNALEREVMNELAQLSK